MMQAPSVVGWTTKERLKMFWQHKKPLVICFISVILIGIGILGLFAFAQVQTLYAKFTGQHQQTTEVINVYNVVDTNGNHVTPVNGDSTNTDKTNSTSNTVVDDSTTTYASKTNKTIKPEASNKTSINHRISTSKTNSINKINHYIHKMRFKEIHYQSTKSLKIHLNKPQLSETHITRFSLSRKYSN